MTRTPQPRAVARDRSAWVRLVFATLGIALAMAASCPELAQAAPVPGAPKPSAQILRLAIDRVTPSTVTTATEPVVSITATVSNVSPRPVTEVNVRIQRAPEITTASALRTTLKLDQHDFDVVGDFAQVSERIEPGQQQQFTLKMPLRRAAGSTAPPGPTLQITKPGVYPLLLNVNATPQFGGPARLDDARFLLPVLGVPPEPGAPDPMAPDARPVPPAPAPPVPITMLWPLADQPRLLAGHTGAPDDRPVMANEDLMDSISAGGRLDGLLSALEFAVSDPIDHDHLVSSSICLAVDPDLVTSVTAMIHGYDVLDDPANVNGPRHNGKGGQAATLWLARVRALAAALKCTLALPYAQADLSAVRSVNVPELTALAVQAPADIVDTALNTKSIRDVAWPDAGVVDTPTARMLRANNAGSVLVAANSIDAPGSAPAGDVARLAEVPGPATTNPLGPPGAAEPLHAVSFDGAVATALAATGSNPQTPSFAPARSRYALSDDSAAARLQDALGAMTWPAVSTDASRARSMLIVPPQQFSAGRDDAGAVLSAAASLIRSGRAVPRSFTALLATPPDPRSVTLDYPEQAIDDGVSTDIVTRVREGATNLEALTAALVAEPQSSLTPEVFSTPLREDLVRTLSLSGYRADKPDAATAAANDRINQFSAGLGQLFNSVTVVSPGGGYTLASAQSPLLLVARNDLPIAIKVRVHIDAPPVMKITDIGDQQLPPRGSRSLRIPAEVTDTRNLFVDVTLTTPAGHKLGKPTSVSVRSNAFGPMLAVITAGAAAILFFLAGRRLLHRFRGQPDRADEGHVRT